MDKLKIVKIIVAVLTFLLVFGMLTALGTIYKKVSAPAPQTADRSLRQPEGSSIESFKIDNGKIYLLVKYGGLADRIVIVNPAEAENKPAVISVQ